jgi:hypothetical protein
MASAGHLLTTPVPEAFQQRVRPWLLACFGEMIAGDREERNHRFLEEALELVQSLGCTASEAHQLVGYVYGREVGQPAQEVGGAMVTLAAFCLANSLDMHDAGETELTRIWTKVEAIRAKQAAKPKHSPLPQHVDHVADPGKMVRLAQTLGDLSDAASAGPWGIWREQIADAGAAAQELADQVYNTHPVIDALVMLDAGGKCPAITGCGPHSDANAALIAALRNNVPAIIAALRQAGGAE